MPRPTRPLLSHSAIIDTAIQILDTKGENALTLRGIAKDLGVNPTSLYNHIGSLEQLMDATVERITSGMVSIPPTDNWRDYLMQAAFEYRAVLLQHPNAILLIVSRRHQNYILPVWEQSTKLLSEIGFTLAESQVLLEQFVSLVIGSTLLESGADHSRITDRGHRYPKTISAKHESSAWRPEEKLKFSMSALLRGMETHLQKKKHRNQ